MKKTIKEWLEELDEPYRTQALNNMDIEDSEVDAYSLCEAVGIAFYWYDSPEGHDYWDELSEQLIKENK